MPKSPVKDSDIVRLHVNGRTYTDIGKELGITRQYAAKIVKKHISLDATITDTDEYRAAVLMEVTQENALSQLSKQLSEYTDEYEKARTGGDPEMATRWAALRLKLLDMMNKVTGLYNEKATKAEPIDINVRFV